MKLNMKESQIDAQVAELLMQLNWTTSPAHLPLKSVDFNQLTGVYESDFIKYYTSLGYQIDENSRHQVLLDLEESCLNVNKGSSSFQKSYCFLEALRRPGIKIDGNTLALINFDNLDLNIYRFQCQRQAFLPASADRPDFILYINGIPVVAIENKQYAVLNPARSIYAEKLGEAKFQLARYAEKLPTLQYGIIFATGIPHILPLPIANYSSTMSKLEQQAIFSVPWRLRQQDVLAEPLTLQRFKYHPSNATFFKQNVSVNSTSESFQILEMLVSREVVCDFLRTYVLYELHGKTEQVKAKKIPRYHQYRDTKRLIAFLTLHNNEPIPAKALCWHVQGSGKSITMIYCAAEICLAFPSRRVAVFLDRIQLRQQMTENLIFHAPLCIGTTKEPATARELQQYLVSGAEKLLVANIQKLNEAFEGKLEDALQTADQSLDQYVMLIDEAHRSQSGDFHLRLQRVFSQSAMIGFTGTPNENSKNLNTFETFGKNIIGIYSPAQGLEDRVIVPVTVFAHGEQFILVEEELTTAVLQQNFFRGSTPSEIREAIHAGYLAFEQTQLVDATTEVITDDTSYLKHALEAFTAATGEVLYEYCIQKRSDRDDCKRSIKSGLREMKRYIKLQLTRIDETRMRALASQAIELLHIKSNRPIEKALFVASSRAAAVAYSKILIEILAEKYPENIIDNRSKITASGLCRSRDLASSVMTLISGAEDFLETSTADPKLIISEDIEASCVADFKNSAFQKDGSVAGQIRIMVVAQKLLTGFDAPALKCMFVDRALTGNTLIQAVSRTNRAFAGKSHGKIYDFQGINTSMLKRFFSREDSLLHEAFRSEEETFSEMEETLHEIQDSGHCTTIQWVLDLTEKSIAAQDGELLAGPLEEKLLPEYAKEVVKTQQKLIKLLKYEENHIINDITALIAQQTGLTFTNTRPALQQMQVSEYATKQRVEKAQEIPLSNYEYNGSNLLIEIMYKFLNKTVIGGVEIAPPSAELIRRCCVIWKDWDVTKPLPMPKTIRRSMRSADKSLWCQIIAIQKQHQFETETETIQYLMDLAGIQYCK